MGDIFLNDVYVGSCADAKKFVVEFKNKRRLGQIGSESNIYYNKYLDYILINNYPGRICRPLIIVEGGVSLITKEDIRDLNSDKKKFSDLLQEGKIEYLDTLEEENAFVATDEVDLTFEHTHLEISPMAMFGINTAQVPYLEYDEPSRLMRGQKTIKQSVGNYALNYLKRLETDRNTLSNPQRPLVETYIYKLLNLDNHPSGQNMTVAIMSYEGYNMEDALILNKSSVDRGLQRSFYFKKYVATEIKYPGGLQDRIGVPNKDIKGYGVEEDYRYLEDDGIIYVGQFVQNGDVLIGKISPPKFIEEIEGFGQMINLNVDSSLSLKEEEFGVVSAINIIENSHGDKQVNILLRTQREPVIGDKFASRHGQKGIIGAIMKEADLPYSHNGIIPDLIFSPHSIPGRKTVSHVIEVLAGKVAALRGEIVDGNGFNGEKDDSLRKQLEDLGFNSSGTEVMYNPKTGKKMQAEIYIGSLYYLRLKHQVDNKIQARGTGPIQLLTRQPSEGRIRGGGLKLGEMEKDALISHGAAILLKERFSSDQTTAFVCTGCGYLADPYLFQYKSKCPICNSSKFNKIELAYAFKLFVNELRAMGISPSFGTKDRFFEE
ncbi:MAG: DNA-directed RNA polymerase subunit B [Nanoarchaeota archaeon]